MASWSQKKHLPLNHGFDYYYGIPYSNDMDKINKNNYWSEYERNELDSKSYNVPLIENFDIIERPVDQTTITDRYTKKLFNLLISIRMIGFLFICLTIYHIYHSMHLKNF